MRRVEVVSLLEHLELKIGRILVRFEPVAERTLAGFAALAQERLGERRRFCQTRTRVVVPSLRRRGPGKGGGARLRWS